MTTPHEEGWLRQDNGIPICVVTGLLSTTPHEEGWLRPSRKNTWARSISFQPLLTKKDGCDIVARYFARL